MPKQPPPSDDLFARAAEVRAAGATWEAVGEEVGRAARTVRRWPRMYADRWFAAFIQAERNMASQADCESVLTLRRLLLSHDEKVRWHAAKALIARRIERDKISLKTPAQPQRALSSAAAEIIAYLDELPDAELADIAAIAVEEDPLPATPAA